MGEPLDTGRWIMLTRKPPTRPSPAKFSLFWSVPARDLNAIERQRERFYDKYSDTFVDYDGNEYDPDHLPDSFVELGGLSDNAEMRRIIQFMGIDITLESQEYVFKNVNDMRELLFSIPDDAGEPLYELVENNEASKLMLEVAMDTDLRQLYDAALLDGCTPAMARVVAMGQDISSDVFEFPPVGYYRPILHEDRENGGYFEMFSDVGEPIHWRGTPAASDPFWMLRETPPFSEEELRQQGRFDQQSADKEERRNRITRAALDEELQKALADLADLEEDESEDD